MFKSNDKNLYISICCLLVILLIVGIVFWMNKTNNKPDNHDTSKNNNKEKFTDVTAITSDELLKKLQHRPDGALEVVALENLSQNITDLFNSKISEKISTINEIHRIGVTKIIECGPNNVLSGLIKRIEKSFELFSISDRPSLDKTLI